MQQKAFTLLNKGMNRDLSISKAGESSAYENHNIRILARDHDTLLSVTNERGNKDISLGVDANFNGDLVGWNVLNNHIILFTHSSTDGKDRIYRVDYENDAFYMYGTYDSNGNFLGQAKNKELFAGNLGFSLEHPIESVVYYETATIQKIYWVDGEHVLRFMNFMADDEEVARWEDTYFDSNRAADFSVTAEITKDNSGNTRANGVVQYFLTYYNKHGQETGIVWVSDLVYLSPLDKGGAADGTNNNKVIIELMNLDKSFTHYRLYSIFRSSLNGTPVAYIVADGEINSKTIRRVIRTTGRSNSTGSVVTSSSSSSAGVAHHGGTGGIGSTPNRPRTQTVVETVQRYAKIVDDGAHLISEDVSKLLYLGSQEVIAGTLTHKDQTLFLGDLQSIGKDSYAVMDEAVASMRDSNGMCKYITFQYSDGDGDICDIPYHADTGTVEYDSQLKYTSSQIKSFKGGEKYRFALTFRRKDGTTTEAFWIGDAENELYPVIYTSDKVIKRIVASCTIPDAVYGAMGSCGFETAQLMIAEATYADRSVKAQGIVNPTVFNVWDRYNSRLYGEASWISRPRNSGFAWKHFEPIHNSTSSTGEIECNYWTTASAPTPYYRRSGNDYVDKFDGIPDCNYMMLLYKIEKAGGRYKAAVWLIEAVDTSGGNGSQILTYTFDQTQISGMTTSGDAYVEDASNHILWRLRGKYNMISPTMKKSAESLFPLVKAAAIELGLDEDSSVNENTFVGWCHDTTGSTTSYYNNKIGIKYTTELAAFNNGTSHDAARWSSPDIVNANKPVDYSPAYYKKHLMFVDENLVTLNSPELEYEAVSFDKAENYKFRIIGVAPISAVAGDYTVDSTPGKLPGENLLAERFVGSKNAGGMNGLISWPLWKEYGLKERRGEEGYTFQEDILLRTSSDYLWSGDVVMYWLHMWNHSGKINGYSDSDNSDYSRLNSKVFANIKYSHNTIYNSLEYAWDCDLSQDALRVFNYTSSQYVGLKVGNSNCYYDANVQTSLMPAGLHKYPVLYSSETYSTAEDIEENAAFLYLNSPVHIDYYSSPHAVIELPTTDNLSPNGGSYKQKILPYIAGLETKMTISSGAICPWWGGTATSYTNTSYDVEQDSMVFEPASLANRLSLSDRYLFIGEIYYDYKSDPTTDTRYGSDAKNNRFVTAGPQYTISQLASNKTMYANQGDTYFQRWDCLKTKPAAKTDVTNSVIDITSVMLETHINIDGRTDNQRDTGYLASIKTEEYGSLNPVYSQQDNYLAQRDLDEDYNLDSYRSSITWSLEKHDSAEVDEWSHVTLASSLKLDGDKGICRALRRFQNSIIAFQDRGIAEVLFNSRTQLTTTDGVPVEIANSGKVDGKRYISNKFGCTNKWSIVEGKSALYFVDNINKCFCAFTGNVEPISTKLNFDVWFRRINAIDPWTPASWENICAHYDRIHSDVYLVTGQNGDEACLVYNENLGTFSSFFDYRRVPMMANVDDRFVSYRNNKLWKQNEGLYCNFFGEQFDYWVNYRVTPDPYGDKIWTNIDYRADFFEVLDSRGVGVVDENKLINADEFGSIRDLYKENETFSTYRIWDEYQTTGEVSTSTNTSQIDPVRKKFRIWRVTIPRAMKHDTNRRGLDRIRNPWVNIEFRKKMADNKQLMQLHDIIVKYFE